MQQSKQSTCRDQPCTSGTLTAGLTQGQLSQAQTSHHPAEASHMGFEEPMVVVGWLPQSTSPRLAAPVPWRLALSLLPLPPSGHCSSGHRAITLPLAWLVLPQASHIKMGSQFLKGESQNKRRGTGKVVPSSLEEAFDPYSRTSYLHLRSPFPNQSPSGVK